MENRGHMFVLVRKKCRKNNKALIDLSSITWLISNGSLCVILRLFSNIGTDGRCVRWAYRMLQDTSSGRVKVELVKAAAARRSWLHWLFCVPIVWRRHRGTSSRLLWRQSWCMLVVLVRNVTAECWGVNYDTSYLAESRRANFRNSYLTYPGTNFETSPVKISLSFEAHNHES